MNRDVVSDKFYDILAAGAPLQAILGAVLASHSGSSNPQEASQTACNLLATCKGFQDALLNIHGLIPVKFGPPASFSAAAVFAGGCACWDSHAVHCWQFLVSGCPAQLSTQCRLLTNHDLPALAPASGASLA
jgi:hypothetical protein